MLCCCDAFLRLQRVCTVDNGHRQRHLHQHSCGAVREVRLLWAAFLFAVHALGACACGWAWPRVLSVKGSSSLACLRGPFAQPRRVVWWLLVTGRVYVVAVYVTRYAHGAATDGPKYAPPSTLGSQVLSTKASAPNMKFGSSQRPSSAGGVVTDPYLASAAASSDWPWPV